MDTQVAWENACMRGGSYLHCKGTGIVDLSGLFGCGLNGSAIFFRKLWCRPQEEEDRCRRVFEKKGGEQGVKVIP